MKPLPRIATANMKVLVVDDDAGVRRLIQRQLRGLGVVVSDTAADGTSAMQVIDAAPARFDVVICDLEMPNEDGLVLFRRLAALPRPPAIIITSGQDPLVLEAAGRLGRSRQLTILGTLQKPHSIKALALMLAGIKTPPPTPAAHMATAFQLDAVEVERALDAGQVEAWFQPQIELRTGRVAGVEALLRLRHPRHGLLLPGSFIDVAHHALLAALTAFALRQAVTWCRVWHDCGFDLSVSVNVSAATLHDVEYPDQAAALCVEHGVHPSKVVFELTESSLATDAMALLDIMTRLRLKGFGTSIDDFGTGYSSLEQLRKLPFNELKLDHRLVQDATHNPRSRMILQSSLAMASHLGMSSVAEGVESVAALDLVSGLGCKTVQGFLIARPMPAAAVAGWLAGYRPVQAHKPAAS